MVKRPAEFKHKKAALGVLICGLVLFAFAVPVVFVPCYAHQLCQPDLRQSLTRHFLGFGAETSWSFLGNYYFGWGPSWGP